MTPRFTIVPDASATEIKDRPRRHWGRPRSLSPIAQTLMSGQMVFVTDKKTKPSNTTFKRRGLVLRSRAEDGGVYYWTEPAA